MVSIRPFAIVVYFPIICSLTVLVAFFVGILVIAVFDIGVVLGVFLKSKGIFVLEVVVVFVCDDILDLFIHKVEQETPGFDGFQVLNTEQTLHHELHGLSHLVLFGVPLTSGPDTLV